MAKLEWSVVQQADGSVLVAGLDATQVTKALEYMDYLKDYRKGYSKRKKAKYAAYKSALQQRGVDTDELEAEAIKAIRRQK